MFAFKLTDKECKEYGLGKNWYCEKETESEDDEDEAIDVNDIMALSIPPQDKAIRINELWERQRKIAVITGDKKDIERFLTTQYFIAQKGVDFARLVQNITEVSPKYSNDQSYYKNITDEAIKDHEKQQILSHSHKRFGLVFVYKSGCSYCSRQLPILLTLRAKYNFEILGISVDGDYYPGLDENINDHNVINDPSIQAFPTILLIDKEVTQKIFLSKGLTTLDDLETRLVNRIKERLNE